MKNLLAIIGFISLGLGIIGAFLPLLPTTPFILLAAALFAKSSEKMHQWLHNHRIFGEILRDFNENKTIPLYAKVISISTMWISILFSIFTIASGKIWLQIILASIAIGVSIHILRYKTKKKT
ncbi:MAG: YbaN family protein [Paludibacter sp.]